MTRRTTHLLIVGTLVLAAGSGALFGFAAQDPRPCLATKFEFPNVEKACHDGGQKAATTLMKAVVKRAKDAGSDVNCKTCHTDTRAWGLTPNAVTDYGKWRG
jgi:hypothetical protein